MTSTHAPLQPQVGAHHYQPGHYDELHRWISYWYQIQSIARTQPQSVLEIGVGSGVLSGYLRSRLNLNVTTFDFDAALNPDLVGDVRQLGSQIEPASYDAVVAFQVLEHLPFDDFPAALQQLARASREHVILSLPHHGHPLRIRLQFGRLNLAFGRKLSRNARWNFDGEHHWEIGTRGHPLSRIRRAIHDVMEIQRDYFCPDHPYHHFFECRKRPRP